MNSTFTSAARSALLVILTACNAKSCNDLADPEKDPCAAYGIWISPTSVTMPVLATSQMQADVYIGNRQDIVNKLPEKCESSNPALVGWRSANPAVAIIANEGAQRADVIGVSADTTSIIATVGGPAAFRHPADTIKVRVVPLVPAIRLSANALTLVVGQTGSVTPTVVDQDNRDVTARASISWQSNAATIASVDQTSGVITGIAKGPATITATAVVAGATATAPLSVTVADPPQQPVASLTISGPTRVRSTESIVLQATAKNAAGDLVADPTMSWQSSAPTKATVARTASDAHKADVAGFLVGTVTITAKAASGKTASIDVDVVPGPVAIVTIGGLPDKLRAGKSVQLSASATDANKNAIAGQQFTWSSSATDLARVDDAGFVSTIAGGTPSIRALATGTAVSASGVVTVLPKRVAYALANEPGTATYTASAATSFNSAGGAITVSRLGTGSYRVSFPGQQPLADEVETFMVSGYGGNTYCKVASWRNGTASDLVADVRCFAFGGDAADAQFTVSLVSDDALGNRFAFALADQLAAPAPYTPVTSFNASALRPRPPVVVSRLSVGKYAVKFTGNSGGAFDPEGIIVTAYGTGNERCQPGSELNGETVLVNCWTGAAVSYESVPADSRFTIVMSDRGRGFAERAGFAFVDDVVVIANGGSMSLTGFNGYNSTTGAVRAQRRGNGVFDVTFVGLASGPSGSRFVAHASDMDEDDSAYCSVIGWSVSGADLVVSVTCWHEEDGTPDDDAFYLFVIQ